MAMLLAPPTMVPTSVSGICSGAEDGAGSTGATTASAGGVGAGGRREGEKIGRSRVAVRALSEIPQSGLPIGGAGAPATADAAPTSRVGVTGIVPVGVAAWASDANPAPNKHNTGKYRRIIALFAAVTRPE